MPVESTLDRRPLAMDTRGVARLTPLSFAEAHGLGRGFGLDLAESEALDLGSVNSNFRWTTADGRQFFARIYEEQGVLGACTELRLLRHLSSSGVPVAVPVAQASGEDHALTSAGKALSVFAWKPGVHLCNALVTPERTRKLGENLARVHFATPKEPLSAGRFGIDGLRERLARIIEQAPAFADAAHSIRAKLDAYAAKRDPELPQGLIHGDLFRDNVLWQGDELVALLDFESVSRGPFAYDLAVCLLAWCYTDAFRTDCAVALLDGYQSVRQLEAAERVGLRSEAAIACLRFATTRITDFSMRAPAGTPPKRDYRRFLQRLDAIEAGVVDELIRASSPSATPAGAA
jgi:homoserine kinase type II